MKTYGTKVGLLLTIGTSLFAALAIGVGAMNEGDSKLAPLDDLTSIRGANCAVACTAPCTAGWVGSAIHGGIECQHGPENDPDCGWTQWVGATPPEPPAGYDDATYCAEENGNKPSPAKEAVDTDGDDKCYCFKCFKKAVANRSIPKSQCEAEIQDWIAYCGIVEEKDKNNTCEMRLVADDAPQRRWKPAVTPNENQDDCDTEMNDGIHYKYLCGGDPQKILAYGCVSKNCSIDPNANQWNEQGSGDRWECMPAP